MWARQIPAIVGVTLDASAGPRTGDRGAPCLSCTETNEPRARGYEGAVLAVAGCAPTGPDEQTQEAAAVEAEPPQKRRRRRR